MTVLLQEFRKFFRTNFRQFEQQENRHSFQLAYPEKDLAIVCEFDGSVQAEMFPGLQTVGPVALVYLKAPDSDRKLVELLDTRANRNWEYILSKKIRALIELVGRDTNLCGTCNRYEVPVTVIDERGAKSVRLRCPQCGQQRELSHGSDLKTMFHKYLK